jgi:hypothetical protein
VERTGSKPRSGGPVTQNSIMDSIILSGTGFDNNLLMIYNGSADPVIS